MAQSNEALKEELSHFEEGAHPLFANLTSLMNGELAHEEFAQIEAHIEDFDLIYETLKESLQDAVENIVDYEDRED